MESLDPRIVVGVLVGGSSGELPEHAESTVARHTTSATSVDLVRFIPRMNVTVVAPRTHSPGS